MPNGKPAQNFNERLIGLADDGLSLDERVLRLRDDLMEFVNHSNGRIAKHLKDSNSSLQATVHRMIESNSLETNRRLDRIELAVARLAVGLERRSPWRRAWASLKKWVTRRE